MASCICIFEDNSYSNLFPLAYLRPVYNLRSGILTLREKIQQAYPKAKFTLHCRPYLADYTRLRYPKLSVNEITEENVLFINGRSIVNKKFAKSIPLNGSDAIYLNGKTVVAARMSGMNLQNLKQKTGEVFSASDFAGVEVHQIESEIINYPWDLIRHNGDQILADFISLKVKQRKKRIKKYSGVHLLNPKNIIIGEGSVLKPGVVIDAEEGPVYIGKNVTIMPFSVIVGPAYIGDNTVIKVGAKIYHGTTIGPMCKVGGEIEASILHSYSNKQHDGFLGHSYLGSWVNLGAGTTNSDLKNNYSTVKMNVNSETIDSGMQFMGLIMGDHSKTAINTTVNTGTVVGISSNVFCAGFAPKFVPSFSWGGTNLTTYNIEKAIEVAKKVMTRRKVEFSKEEESLFHTIFNLTIDERRKL